MSGKSISQSISSFIYNLNFNDIPKDVVDKAKDCLIHSLACALAGYNHPWMEPAKRLLGELRSVGEAVMYIDGLKGSAEDISFINSIISQGTGQEDMHTASVCHPGAIVIPTALAVCDEYNLSGKDLITAIIIGYEIMCRAGSSVVSSEFTEKFRPTSFFGPFGAMSSTAKLINLSEEQIANAIGLVANLTFGLNEFAKEGTADVLYQNGFSASNGVRAAKISKFGVNSSRNIFEGPAGFWAAYGKQEYADKILEGLGDTYEINSVYCKIAAACYTTQTAVDLMLKMAKSSNVNVESIKSIDIFTYKAAKEYPGAEFKGPFRDEITAKMSLPYGIAAVLIFKSLDPTIYQKYENKYINKIASMCSILEDQNLTHQYPAKQGCKIKIQMLNGDIIEDNQEDVRYMSRPEIIHNFQIISNLYFVNQQVEKLINNALEMENITSVREFSNMLIRE